MTEPTYLAMTYDDLYARVLAMYADPTGKETEAAQLVQDGYLLFLNSYTWPFVTTNDTLALDVDVDGTYDLPADWAAMAEDLVIVGYRPSMRRVTARRLLEYVEGSSHRTGRPYLYSTRPKAEFDGSTSQPMEILVWPWPDQAYSAILSYRFEVQALSTGKYPVGGSAHSLTILHAALLLWEEKQGHTSGMYHDLYTKTYLPMSIQGEKDSQVMSLGRSPQHEGVVCGPAPTATWNGVEL
jgi:hypothetical protein